MGVFGSVVAAWCWEWGRERNFMAKWRRLSKKGPRMAYGAVRGLAGKHMPRHIRMYTHVIILIPAWISREEMNTWRGLLGGEAGE
jgi:hypothetical protein